MWPNCEQRAGEKAVCSEIPALFQWKWTRTKGALGSTLLKVDTSLRHIRVPEHHCCFSFMCRLETWKQNFQLVFLVTFINTIPSMLCKNGRCVMESSVAKRYLWPAAGYILRILDGIRQNVVRGNLRESCTITYCITELWSDVINLLFLLHLYRVKQRRSNNLWWIRKKNVESERS